MAVHKALIYGRNLDIFQSNQWTYGDRFGFAQAMSFKA